MEELDRDSTGPQMPDDAFSDLVTIKVDSCHSIWYFQPARMRFRRALKGIGISGVCTGWRPYCGLRFDEGSNGFTVFLDKEGTRLLTSWRHPVGSDECTTCAGDRVEEESPTGIPQLVPWLD